MTNPNNKSKQPQGKKKKILTLEEAKAELGKGKQVPNHHKGNKSKKGRKPKYAREPRAMQKGTLATKQYEVQRLETPYVAKPGSLLPRYRETRLPMANISTWTSDYLICRKAYLDFTGVTRTGIEVAAQLEDFTGTNTSGTGDKDKMYRSMLQAASHKRIKDWDNTQVAYFLELIPFAIELCVAMSMQLTVRRANKLLAESDTTGIWTEESINSFLAGLGTRNIQVPLLAVNIARALCVFWKGSVPIPERNLPAEIFIPFSPELTLERARILMNSLKARQVGVLHAEKTELPMVPLTRELIESLMHQLVYDSDEMLFWLQHMQYVQDTGGVEVVVDMTDGTPWDRITNSTTSYTDRLLRWLGDHPCDEWGLIDALLHPYESTHNKTGGLNQGTIPNGTLSFKSAGLNDTAFSDVAFPAGVSSVIKFSWPMINKTIYTDGVSTDAVGVVQLNGLSGKEIYYKSSISNVEWDDFEDLAYVTYFKTPFKGSTHDEGYNNGNPSSGSKKTDNRPPD